MFTKVLIVCIVAAAAMAIEYPPGVNPLLCPDYPYCQERVLPRFAPIAYSLRNPYYSYSYVRALPIPTKPAYLSAAKYPADVDPTICPNYPFCN